MLHRWMNAFDLIPFPITDDPIRDLAVRIHEVWRRKIQSCSLFCHIVVLRVHPHLCHAGSFSYYDNMPVSTDKTHLSDSTTFDMNNTFDHLPEKVQEDCLREAAYVFIALNHHMDNDTIVAEHFHNEWMRRTLKGKWNAHLFVPFHHLSIEEQYTLLLHIYWAKQIIKLQKS